MNNQFLCGIGFVSSPCIILLKGVCQEEGKEVKNSFELDIFSSLLFCRNLCSGMTQRDANQVLALFGQQAGTKPGLKLVKAYYFHANLWGFRVLRSSANRQRNNPGLWALKIQKNIDTSRKIYIYPGKKNYQWIQKNINISRKIWNKATFPPLTSWFWLLSWRMWRGKDVCWQPCNLHCIQSLFLMGMHSLLPHNGSSTPRALLNRKNASPSH